MTTATPENLELILAQLANWHPRIDVLEEKKQAQAWIDSLDRILARVEDNKELYVRGVRRLRRLCHAIESLPQSCTSTEPVELVDQDSISQSNFSDVYRGKLSGLLVAVKFLRIHVNDTPRVMKAFRNEVVAWKLLKHPNIARLICVPSGKIAMVSEWMDNGTIAEFLTRHPNTDRMPLIKDIAEGLRYMHSLDMVHGDLKPQNILINSNGHALLSDFGISTLLHSTSAMTGSSGTPAGTVRWMAPELLAYDSDNEEKSKPSMASDVFSVGLVFWALYSDEPVPLSKIRNNFPFSQRLIAGDRPERPVDRPPVIMTDSLWSLIQWIWVHDQESRPTIDQVAASLSSPVPPFTFWKHRRPQETLRFFSNLQDIRTRKLTVSPSGRYVLCELSSSDEDCSALGILSIGPHGVFCHYSLALDVDQRWRRTLQFTADSRYIYSVLSSPENGQLGTLEVWECATGRAVAPPLTLHHEASTATCVSNGSGDISIVVFARRSRMVQLTNVTANDPVDELDLSADKLQIRDSFSSTWKLSCSIDGRRMVLVDYNKFVVLQTNPLAVLQIWNEDRLSQLCQRPIDFVENFKVVWSAGSLHLLTAHEGSSRFHDEGFIHLSWEDLSSPPRVTFIAPQILPEGRFFFAVSANGKKMAIKNSGMLEFVELPAGRLIWSLNVDRHIADTSFADNEGCFIYIQKANKTITLYEVGNTPPILRLNSHKSMTLIDNKAILRFVAHINRP